jgi:hypothetical protein
MRRNMDLVRAILRELGKGEYRYTGWSHNISFSGYW